MYSPMGKKRYNYWWNDEISKLRKEMTKSRRKAQSARTRGMNDATHLSELYKDSKRELARAIKANKERCWRELSVTLDMDPWSRSYRATMSRMTRRVQTDGLQLDGVRSIVDELFLTRPTQRKQGTLRNTTEKSEEMSTAGSQRMPEEDLMDAYRRINPNKEADVDGIPGMAVKALVERRAEKVLRVLNAVNDTGKIPTKWKIARVMLIPQPGRDSTLTSSFRPTSVLLARCKVWEHTFKNLIKEILGLDPFGQYELRRRVSTVKHCAE